MAVIFNIGIAQPDFALITGYSPRKNHMASRRYFGWAVLIRQIQVNKDRYRLAVTNKTPPRRDHIPLFGVTLDT